MVAGPVGWTVMFRGCEAPHDECVAARFEVAPPRGAAVIAEVRTTAQIEHILAGELGKESLGARERQAILAVGGRQLIERCLAEGAVVNPLLFLDSRLFRDPGAERRLLRECGLLPG